MELSEVLRSPTTQELSEHEILELAFKSRNFSAGEMFNADGEDLAEGGGEQFLWRLAPFLKEQNVRLDAITQNLDGLFYTITVNGAETVLYSEGEISGNIWWLTTERISSLVNQLLINAGSHYRMYTLDGGGNDGMAVFLTEDEVARLRSVSASGIIG